MCCWASHSCNLRKLAVCSLSYLAFKTLNLVGNVSQESVCSWRWNLPSQMLSVWLRSASFCLTTPRTKRKGCPTEFLEVGAQSQGKLRQGRQVHVSGVYYLLPYPWLPAIWLTRRSQDWLHLPQFFLPLSAYTLLENFACFINLGQSGRSALSKPEYKVPFSPMVQDQKVCVRWGAYVCMYFCVFVCMCCVFACMGVHRM